MKLTEHHEVRRNNAFRGLSSEEAFSINSYFNFRNIRNPLKQAALQRDEAVFQQDFLDDASDSSLKGAWSV